MPYDRELHHRWHIKLQALRKELQTEVKAQVNSGNVPLNDLVGLGLIEGVMVISKALLLTIQEPPNAQQ